ncbi:MAG: chemotaxis protein CheW [Pyrinomonadaceae bacterium]
MLDEIKETSESSAKSANRGGKFLTFFLKDEEYGIEILKVQEIIGMLPITRVPRTQSFIRGVVNLRGKIIPVMDIRLKFEMEPKEDTEDTCIIVVQSEGLEIGIVVDKVSEVLDIAEAEIEDVPSFGTDVDTHYLLGVGKTNEKVRLLLAIDRVVSRSEMSEFTKNVEASMEEAA